MGLFDINYDELNRQNMPVRWRKRLADRPVHSAWMSVLVAPVKWLYVVFKANRKANLYNLAHNSQVCYLEALLNDAFDHLSRRIYISNPDWHDAEYIYRDDEDKPVWMGTDGEIGGGTPPYDEPVWLYTDAETFDLPYTFVVNVPASISFDMDRMKAIINNYKLVGKNYIIVTF